MQNVHEILESLSNQRIGLETDQTTVAKANAICNVVGKTISVFKLILVCQKHMGIKQPIPALDLKISEKISELKKKNALLVEEKALLIEENDHWRGMVSKDLRENKR